MVLGGCCSSEASPAASASEPHAAPAVTSDASCRASVEWCALGRSIRQSTEANQHGCTSVSALRVIPYGELRVATNKVGEWLDLPVADGGAVLGGGNCGKTFKGTWRGRNEELTGVWRGFKPWGLELDGTDITVVE
jgi:hypothetical protein